jgi:uncharacterized protein (DUF488 family)
METPSQGASPPDIFTIGYEGMVQDQLLDLLLAAGVGTLLDVRAVPLSRKAGFSKGVLGASLQARGIFYVHDRRLGTPKAGREAARRGRTAEMTRVFEAHMGTDTAREGLADAIGLVQRGKTCLLCFEREPHACHRSIVAQMIHAETGQAIRHL